MRLYKLSTRDYTSRTGTPDERLWAPGKTIRASGLGPVGGPGWIHAYTHPLLAVLMNPAAEYTVLVPRLWEANAVVVHDHAGLLASCRELTTIREVPVPLVLTEHRVRFAIGCARLVEQDSDWALWAERWLDGRDRGGVAAAEAAVRASFASTVSSAAASAAAAAASAYAAFTFTYSAYCDRAARAAAHSATHAAVYAAAYSTPFDPIAIAREACS